MMNGRNSQASANALLGGFQTKIFHANGDGETNRWAEDQWGYPAGWSKWSQDQRDTLLKAQDALNRLGPTLVEMGLLAQ